MKNCGKTTASDEKTSASGLKTARRKVFDHIMDLVFEAEQRNDFMGARVILSNLELLFLSKKPPVAIAEAYARIAGRAARKARRDLYTKRKVTSSTKELLDHAAMLAGRLSHFLTRNGIESETIEEIKSATDELENLFRSEDGSDCKSAGLISTVFEQLNILLDGISRLELLAEPAQGSRKSLIEEAGMAAKAADSCFSRIWPARWTDPEKCEVFARQAMALLQADAWHHARTDAAYESMREVSHMQLNTVCDAVAERRYQKARELLKAASTAIRRLQEMLATVH